jgi:AAT family amino acid transporter
LNFRKSVHLYHPGPLPIKAPLFPVLQWIGIILLSAILITMAFSPDFRVAWIVGVPFIVIISIAFLFRRKSLAVTTAKNLKL